MLDIKFIRQNLKKVKEALSKKHTKFDLDEILELDSERKDLITEIEKLRAERNKISTDKSLEAVKKGKELKEKLKTLEPKLAKVEKEFFTKAALLHNIPHPTVPHHKQGSKIEKTWGKKPKFDLPAGRQGFKPKTHIQLGRALDIIDIERAAKVSGSRFGYLKKQGALLEFALINYICDLLLKHGFIPMIPPVLVRERAMFGSGFFPTEKIEYYKMEKDDLYLAGTAEVPLCAYHSGEVLNEKDLPLKYFGFSSCFRREAGSYGKDTYGILRVHQFDKIEMFVFANPKDSWREFSTLQKIVEEILQKLELPYQVVNMSGGELGAPNAKKYDTEVWLPGQAKFRELTSCSHDTDFQARRLNIKFRTIDGKTEFVHTLNSTACAIGRTIIAILENYQQKDGSVKIPKVLQKYCGFKVISTKVRK